MRFQICLLLILSCVIFSDSCYVTTFDVCFSLTSVIDYAAQLIIKVHETAPALVVSEKKNNITFELYTQAKSDNPVICNVNSTDCVKDFLNDFDPNKLTFFIVHGFLVRNVKTGMCREIRDAYLNHQDVNVIVVNWADIAATPSYAYNVNNIETAADEILRMIKILQKEGLDLNTVTIVGHSLGAHISGIVGDGLKNEIGVIVGLDPAYPEIKHLDSARKLSAKDAQHVLVIHTNAGRFGYPEAIGTADFYVGDGTNQSGCWSVIDVFCAHRRAWELFAESISSTVGFWGRKCKTVNAARCTASFMETQPCWNGDLAPMGGFIINRTVNGIYHIETNGQAPFAIPIKDPSIKGN